MITHSEHIAAIGKALAAAQGEIDNAGKNASNSHFGSKYADLSAILNAVREALPKHGIAFTQHPSFESGVVTVETLLIHDSGEWIKSAISAPVTKQDAQGVGSATTYCRRYSLAAIAGIAQEDDDAEGAVGRGRVASTPAPSIAVHLDEKIVQDAKEAPDFDALTAVWNRVPVGARHGYKSLFAEQKARLAEAAK